MKTNSVLLSELKTDIQREFPSIFPQALVSEFENDLPQRRIFTEEDKLFFEILKKKQLKWPELSEEQIHTICEEVTADLIPLLSNVMYAYYLPAFLIIILDEPKIRDAFIWDSVIYSLTPLKNRELEHWQLSRWAMFNDSQAKLIWRFLDLLGSTSAREEFPHFRDFSLEEVKAAESIWEQRAANNRGHKQSEADLN